MAQVEVFPSQYAIAERLLQEVVELAENRIIGTRKVKIALSGGTTPKRAYELLAHSKLDPEKIEFYMVDERYVPTNDERSNERMIRDALRVENNGFEFFPMYREGGVGVAAERYNTLLRANVDKFDLVLLGMGDDGHTASIFPGMWPDEGLNAFCVASRAPVVCADRITLTMRAICWARQVVFMVCGEQKAMRLSEVLNTQPSEVELPARYVAHHALNCRWWIDEPAGSRL